MIRLIGFIFRSRWNLVRLVAAALMVWVLAADSGARIARMTLSELPGFDYAAEIDVLRSQGRYGEAELLANAGLEDADADHESIRRKLSEVVSERDSVIRRALDVGKGALIGRGDSLESLIGAITTDLFVIGDVRDLVIEGGKFVIDGESDELVVLLSVAGVVTTVVPEIDWAPAILKSARKAGHAGEKLASELVTLIRKNRVDELRDVFQSVKKLSDAASPGAAMRWMKYADSSADLAKIAEFASRGRSAAAALHVTGSSGVEFLKIGRLADAQTVARSAEIVERAGRKGVAGANFLKSGAARRLLRPHPIRGLSKGFAKHNVSRLIERAAERIDPWGGTLLAFGFAWFLVECALLRMTITTHRRRSHARHAECVQDCA